MLTDEDACTTKFSFYTKAACQQFLTDLRILRNCCSFRGRTQEANIAKQTRQVKTQHSKSNTISILEIFPFKLNYVLYQWLNCSEASTSRPKKQGQLKSYANHYSLFLVSYAQRTIQIWQ